MKRSDLIRHLRRHGCHFTGEGARHSKWFNPQTREVEYIPRHTEIHNPLAQKICRNLSIPIIGRQPRR